LRVAERPPTGGIGQKHCQQPPATFEGHAAQVWHLAAAEYTTTALSGAHSGAGAPTWLPLMMRLWAQSSCQCRGDPRLLELCVQGVKRGHDVPPAMPNRDMPVARLVAHALCCARRLRLPCGRRGRCCRGPACGVLRLRSCPRLAGGRRVAGGGFRVFGGVAQHRNRAASRRVHGHSLRMVKRQACYLQPGDLVRACNVRRGIQRIVPQFVCG